jgi:SAM-dependent methyltransferase
VKPARSLGAEYFDRVYAQSPDPWNFETSQYELEKYHATVEALGSRRFRSAFEIGCSIGVLTSLMAPNCERLLAVDVSVEALERARKRCAGEANVTFARMSVPHDFPSDTFDLVLVSEVAYYWSKADLSLSIDKIAGAARGGIVELVHYLPKVYDYPQSGDDVHSAFLADSRFTLLRNHRTEKYRIDVLAA